MFINTLILLSNKNIDYIINKRIRTNLIILLNNKNIDYMINLLVSYFFTSFNYLFIFILINEVKKIINR